MYIASGIILKNGHINENFIKLIYIQYQYNLSLIMMKLIQLIRFMLF